MSMRRVAISVNWYSVEFMIFENRIWSQMTRWNEYWKSIFQNLSSKCDKHQQIVAQFKCQSFVVRGNYFKNKICSMFYATKKSHESSSRFSFKRLLLNTLISFIITSFSAAYIFAMWDFLALFTIYTLSWFFIHLTCATTSNFEHF